jgi:TetR/AcrR family transcriptional regulator, transcriptional repressor for nem operon
VSDLSEAMRCALHKGTNRIVERLSRCIEEGRSDGSVYSSVSSDQLAEALYQMWLGATLLTKVRRDDSALKTAMHSTRAALGLAACRT